jgi:hypothetical protein
MKKIGLLAILLLIGSFIAIGKVYAPAGTNLYLQFQGEPYSTREKTYGPTPMPIGTIFTVTVYGENFTDVYALAFGLTWNPAVLNLTSHYDLGIPGWVPHIYKGDFLEGSGITTGFLIGVVDYTAGTADDITYGRTGMVSGKTGTGPGLCTTIEFTVVGFGDSTINLRNCDIIDSSGTSLPGYPKNSPYDCTVKLSELLHHQVTADSQTFWVDTESNSTVTNFGFNQGAYMIYFNVTGTTGLRFCNVSIPKALLNCADPSQWIVLVGTSSVSRTVGGNSTHSFLYFTYTTSTKMVKVIGNIVVPEFSSFPLTIAMLTAILITLIAAKKISKLKK